MNSKYRGMLCNRRCARGALSWIRGRTTSVKNCSDSIKENGVSSKNAWQLGKHFNRITLFDPLLGVYESSPYRMLQLEWDEAWNDEGE